MPKSVSKQASDTPGGDKGPWNSLYKLLRQALRKPTVVVVVVLNLLLIVFAARGISALSPDKSSVCGKVGFVIYLALLLVTVISLAALLRGAIRESDKP